ncbi:MAG: hypothetical protein HYZ49_13520 [Chloroflexi bacterium]|nr:hypothetical protein [Chloroflexota bacterium]
MQNNHYQIERTAWSILITSFVIFCLLVVSAPLTARWYLLTTETAQEASITLVSGTVLILSPGAARPEAVIETVPGLSPGTEIESDPGAQAVVQFFAPDETTALGAMQIYGGTRATLSQMLSPRFMWSALPHHMTVELQSGRARVNLEENAARPVMITLNTPHGAVLLDHPGSYSVEVTDKGTEVAVRQGSATVSAQGQSLTLAADERTLVIAGQPPQGVFTGENNLIVNGDFSESLSPAWSIYQDRTPGDVLGEITRETGAERNVAHFLRPGLNWGRTGIRQVINRDVRDYKTLRLHLAVRLANQNVQSCGQYGSECPLMVKIEYTDKAGNSHEWIQGFYYLADPRLPASCVTCPPPQSLHQRVERNGWYLYDSPELIVLFKNTTTGAEPAIINAISLESQGHAFETFVSEVELLAGD